MPHPELDFTDTTHYSNTILNGNTHFKNTANNEFNIGQNNDRHQQSIK